MSATTRALQGLLQKRADSVANAVQQMEANDNATERIGTYAGVGSDGQHYATTAEGSSVPIDVRTNGWINQGQPLVMSRGRNGQFPTVTSMPR